MADPAAWAVLWTPHLHPLGLAVLVIAVGLALAWFLQRLRARLGARDALRCWLPKLLVAMLLLIAVADPHLRRSSRQDAQGTLAVLVDTSASMDVDDGTGHIRLARARAVVKRIRARVPPGVVVEPLAFDTRLRGALPEQAAAGARPGDPGVVLNTAGRDARLTSCVGIIALTDGGDEPFILTTPPAVPLSIIGVGPGPQDVLDNLAIGAVTAPAQVEVDLGATITADLIASVAHPSFRARLTAVPVTLEESGDSGWQVVAQQTADLSNGRVQVAFNRVWTKPGVVRLRVQAAAQTGEASRLDNERELAVEVRTRSLHVLYFTRELSLDFKALRQELARDGGLTFTALFRTLAGKAGGDRYTLQGDRLDGDTGLERGFPTDVAGLRRYGVIVVGAFAASGWSAAEQAALLAYVEQGGAVVFLGGEQAFGAGGYGESTLAPLLPAVPGADRLERGSFPVAVPATASGHPAVGGLAEALAGEATIDSLNRLGALRPGATALLVASAGGRPAPLVVVQSYGRGRTAMIATNTLNRLVRSGVYGRFWRQFVRHLAAAGEQGGVVRVEWDRERYRPGDIATVTIVPLAAAELRLAASLAAPGTKPVPLALTSAPETGVPGARRARLQLEERGAWSFHLEAVRDGAPLEAIDRTLLVAPDLGEGNRLAVDHVMLAAAAKAGGGIYAPEAEAERVLAALATTLAGTAVASEIPLAGGWWFLAVLLGLLVLEWWLRRGRSLT